MATVPCGCYDTLDKRNAAVPDSPFQMVFDITRDVFLGIAAIPFIYYALALVSSFEFFCRSSKRTRPAGGFLPPVSNLKPVRGLDPGAYENFASFCCQDYPEYEIVFCVGDDTDPVLPVLQRLIRDFPATNIRVLIGSGRDAPNDKVAKLVRLTAEASYDTFVITDADVRVRPDYLRSVVAPLSDPRVGAVTCMYTSLGDQTFTQRLQSIGMISDFYPGILVARQLDGVKFALGQTIVTRRRQIEAFGGYQAIENQPGDDLLVGRMIQQQGLEVVLFPSPVETVPDFQSMGDLLVKRLRWMTVMRHMRPSGHLGLVFTLGLPWAVIAFALRPTAAVAIFYFGVYAIFRTAMTLVVGVYGLQQEGLGKSFFLFPLWDATATAIWLLSFTRRSITWRKVRYRIRDGRLVPVIEQPHAVVEPHGKSE